ncbi:MAG: molecular chaperone DnaK, partial [Pseudonocardiales bacterium]|nr:molecular chaperone DnaK [Pseudonocardiales bacterium]
VSSPERVGREFKRRLGDPTPVMLGGAPHAVTALLAALLSDAVSRVSAIEGAAPDRVVLTHPANWGPYRRELFDEVPQLAGLDEAWMVTEPEAAAAHYAAARHLRDGDTVAVYDLGGGTFDATVLRKRAIGIDILGTPEGIERLGGVDFDDAILAHINYTSGGALSELDMSNPQTGIALARLRQDCILAKEALSVDTEATIPVFLPNRHFDVRLTRTEFEDMIRAQVESTIGALSRTLRSANVEPSDLSAVLLVGGSSRIPLVGRMITEALDRPTLIDAHPKYAVALGAAMLAAEAGEGSEGADSSEGAVTDGATQVVALREPAPINGNGAAAPPHTNGDGPAFGALAAAAAGAGAGAAALTVAGRAGGAREAGALATAPVAAPGHDVPPPAEHDFAPEDDRQPSRESDREPADAAYRNLLPPTNGTPPYDAPTTRIESTGWTGDREQAPPPDGYGGYGRYDQGAPPYPPADDPATAPRPRRRGPIIAAAVAVLVLLAGVLGYVFTRGSTGTPPPSAAPQQSAIVLPPPAQAPAATPLTVAASVPIPAIAGEIPVGKTPGFVAIAPNGKFAYVANRAAGTLTVVDTAVDKVVATIPIPDGPPQYLAFAPDGTRLYVSVFNDPDRSINRVAVLDTATNTVVTTIRVGSRPYALAVKPDGSELYVPNHDSGTVSVIDTRSNTLVTDIRVKPNPHWVEFSKDGSRAYTVNHESNLVSVIDTATRAIVAEIPVQKSPHSIAVHPTQPLVANVNYDSNSVTVIDANTEKVIATVPVGTHPQDVTWAPDGRHLYVTNVDSDNMTVIAVDGYRVTATIPTGEAATSIAVLPDGSKAYVSNLNRGTLTVIDLAA